MATVGVKGIKETTLRTYWVHTALSASLIDATLTLIVPRMKS